DGATRIGANRRASRADRAAARGRPAATDLHVGERDDVDSANGSQNESRRTDADHQHGESETRAQRSVLVRLRKEVQEVSRAVNGARRGSCPGSGLSTRRVTRGAPFVYP